MNHPRQFFAELDPEQLLGAQEKFLNSPHLNEVLIVSGSLFFAIAVAVTGTMVYLKRNRRRRSHRHTSGHPRPMPVPLAVNARSESSRNLGKRRRRRSQRPMNPTLAETGGLPPLRNFQP